MAKVGQNTDCSTREAQRKGEELKRIEKSEVWECESVRGKKKRRKESTRRGRKGKDDEKVK